MLNVLGEAPDLIENRLNQYDPTQLKNMNAAMPVIAAEKIGPVKRPLPSGKRASCRAVGEVVEKEPLFVKLPRRKKYEKRARENPCKKKICLITFPQAPQKPKSYISIRCIVRIESQRLVNKERKDKTEDDEQGPGYDRFKSLHRDIYDEHRGYYQITF